MLPGASDFGPPSTVSVFFDSSSPVFPLAVPSFAVSPLPGSPLFDAPLPGSPLPVSVLFASPLPALLSVVSGLLSSASSRGESEAISPSGGRGLVSPLIIGGLPLKH